MRFDPSRKGFDLLAFQVTGPSLRHLTAAGISGTKKKKF
jgi:hypothetical protein